MSVRHVVDLRRDAVPESGVRMFDAADGSTEEEFADGHHLLRSGAARFSRRLADEQLRKWVKGR
jgi:hypothetical protein